MSKYLIAVVLVGLLSTTSHGIAQQATPKVKNVPVQQTSAASGQQMYTTYCAACHGADGKGDGPAAQAMKVPPVDLTTLSKKNGGVFPSAHVSSVLQFGVPNPAHGTADMPVWGDLMQTMSSSNRDPSVAMHQRITNLTNYLKQIQK
jgi:mono/diheme cytochrome c family protein